MQAALNTDNHTIPIQFGNLCLAFTCTDLDIFANLKELYKIYRSDKLADVKIKLDIVDRLDRAQVISIVSQMGTPQPGNNQEAKVQGIDIEFDSAGNTFAFTIDRRFFDPTLNLKPMNRLLRQVYYTVYQLKYRIKPPGMLVHSCGILRKGKVLLFTGPSGVGKSTIGQLCDKDYGVPLNDEMVLLSWPLPEDRSLIVDSVPILGDLPLRLNTSAPLASVQLLKQSKRTAVRRLGRKEAYLRFIYQVINPAYFGDTNNHAILSLITEFADEITKVTPFYELEFSIDKNLLWEFEKRLLEAKLIEEV